MSDYPVINAQTVAQIVAQSSTYARQIIWVASIQMDEERYNPFTELMGGLGSAKPVKEVLDTAKVRGNTIVFTQEAGLGGKGVQGGTLLIGTEEQRKYSQFTLTIGLHRHAVAEAVTTKDLTFIGTTFDRSARRGLNEWVQRLKCDCIEAVMIGSAQSYNLVFANNKASVNQLTSNDTVSKETIDACKITAGGIKMKPMEVARIKGQRILKYFFQGNTYLFQGLRANSTWQSILATAGVRGDTNYLFGGQLPEWDGVLLNPWDIANTASDAAQGAFCAPRAYLGTAYAAKATTTTLVALTGGGFNGSATLTTLAVAKTQNDYFRYFQNAPFTAFEQTYIAADTTTARYLMVQHASGADVGKFSFFKYTTTDGFTISATGMERLGSTVAGGYVTTLTGSTITWNTAPWVAATYLSEAEIPSGSLIIPVNSKGQPYVLGYFLGNDAVYCGYGSVNGTPSTAMGQRVTQQQDYTNLFGIGVQMVWGATVYKNAALIQNGYLLVYGAWQAPGMPEITA